MRHDHRLALGKTPFDFFGSLFGAQGPQVRQVPVAFNVVSEVLHHVRAGRLREVGGRIDHVEVTVVWPG